jgi:hypothetical protein
MEQRCIECGKVPPNQDCELCRVEMGAKMLKKVRCNKCGFIGDYSEFPKGRDFLQFEYISGCPKKCGNRQSPGDASMRMFGGPRPFEFIREQPKDTDILSKVMHDAGEAS